MTVDIEKLKALAEAAQDDPNSPYIRCRVAFNEAANPSAVLELIAENEKLKVDLRDAKDAALGLRWAVGEFKAENEALRKDKDRLDALDGNFWDVRHSSESLADAGDYTSGVEVVGHWMEKPFERVIGENYTENLRAAIDQAMAADAYPPARPEYPEIDAAISKEQSHD